MGRGFGKIMLASCEPGMEEGSAGCCPVMDWRVSSGCRTRGGWEWEEVTEEYTHVGGGLGSVGRGEAQHH